METTSLFSSALVFCFDVMNAKTEQHLATKVPRNVQGKKKQNNNDKKGAYTHVVNRRVHCTREAIGFALWKSSRKVTLYRLFDGTTLTVALCCG